MIPAEYENSLREAAELTRKARRIVVVHHDDADGLAAGAISVRAAEIAGAETLSVCIEKIHPSILELVHSLDADLFVYADIGSGRADVVSAKLRENQKAILLDHHDPARVKDDRILHLNPELYGFSGESEASGSTAAYLLLRTLDKSTASRIAWAAVIGSAEIPGPLRSLNKIPLDDSVAVGDVRVSGAGGSEKYYISVVDEYWDKASSMYTVLGSVGYYSGGPEAAVKGFLERSLPRDLVSRLEEERSKRFKRLFAKLYREGLRKKRGIQWFEDGGLLEGLGTKTIGTFSSMLRYRRIVDQDKYLVGIMRFKNTIPGLGSIPGRWLKVSVRLPPRLSEKVKRGERQAASTILIEAAHSVGGVADGHAFAASALIPEDRRDEFLELMDGLAARNM